MPKPLTVAFDADDTLWHNEHAFAAAEHRFNELVADWAEPDIAQAVLVAAERRRLADFGVGVKSFALSMIDAACELSAGAIGSSTVQEILRTADELINMPTELIDGAAATIAAVSETYPTMVITKGDLHHQLRRIAAADVGRYCFDIEVVAEKDATTYRRVLERHRIDPARFVMIGNSVVSDVAPVLEIGARAIHIPYDVTWALETATQDPPDDGRWTRVESITEVPALLESLS